MKKYPHEIIEIARELRQRQTTAEEQLWHWLRRHQLAGLKFKRQHRIGNFIVDFYCGELKLVVEVEGGVHQIPEQVTQDVIRFEELEGRGLSILRINNEEVFENTENVLNKILEFRK
jgi:very-short-patch-repair endonuclease